jgi:uncharacterized membrane protein YdjX (TVP38/TMEM64 family)
MADYDSERTTPINNPSTINEVVRVVLVAAFILGAMYIIHATPWGRNLAFRNVERFRNWLDQWGDWGWIMFLLVGTGLITAGFPRIVLSAVAGAMFGLILGIFLAQIATVLGAIFNYCYIRFLGREMAMRRMGNRLQKLDGLLKEHGFMVLLLVRLCPIGNAFLTNCIAGVSAIGFWSFVFSSFLGFLPETIIFALLGSGFSANFQLRLLSSVFLFIIFSIGFIFFFKKSMFASKLYQILREA